MAFDSLGSARRTSTANQGSPDIQNDATGTPDFSLPSTKIEAPAHDESRMLESREAGANRTRAAGPAAGGLGLHEPCDSYLSAKPLLIGCRPSSCKVHLTDRRSLRIPRCMARHICNDPTLLNTLQDDTIPPPVTLATLQELDLISIQNNLNLRIDICHDPELFFQPVSGRKGDAKRNEARKYWSALKMEFAIYFHNAQPHCLECETAGSTPDIAFSPRLPALFDNLREIMQMLVPDSDHEEVANHLDTALLMQQVHVGAMDAIGLSEWLSSLITSHCAPMRDRSAADVTDQIIMGTQSANMEIFVEGLEKLFALLEAMKLDIANHQIRSFRYPLIEGAVEFQHTFFTEAVRAKQVDIADSQQWFRRACFEHRFQCTCEARDESRQRFECFMHGLVHLCNPYEKITPIVVQYDQHRLTRLQEDLQDHIQLDLCLSVFDRRAREVAGPQISPSTMHEELKLRIICLTEDDDGNGGAISDHLDAIGVELTRAAFSLRPTNRKNLLQISRFDFDRTSESLHQVFRIEDQQRSTTKDFLHSLELRAMQHAAVFAKMTTLEISNAQKQWAQARSTKEVLLAEWDEIARKIAHIGVVHWRVWETICYSDHHADSTQCELDSSATANDGTENTERISLSRHSSPSLTESSDQNSEWYSVLEKEPASTQLSGICIQRHDSGFAEQEEDFESDIENRCKIRSRKGW